MKKIPGIILLLLFGTELIVFLTDLEFSFSDHIFGINAVLIVVTSIYLAYIIKAVWLKILASFLSFLIGSTILGLFLFTTTFGCKDEVEIAWEIENYELDLTRNICWGGIPGQQFYVLHKKYVFGLLKKRVDIIFAPQTEEPVCILEFEGSRLVFDICEGKLVTQAKQ